MSILVVTFQAIGRVVVQHVANPRVAVALPQIDVPSSLGWIGTCPTRVARAVAPPLPGGVILSVYSWPLVNPKLALVAL